MPIFLLFACFSC